MSHLWDETAPGIMRVVHAHHLFPDVGQAKAEEINHLQAGVPASSTQQLEVQHLAIHNTFNTLSPPHSRGALQAPAQHHSLHH